MKPLTSFLVLLALLEAGFAWPLAAGQTVTGAAQTVAITRASLAGKRFRFSWKSADSGGFNGIATLNPDGSIAGINSPNESTWSVDEAGRLRVRHADGRVSTRYDKARLQEGALSFEGPFLFREGIVHLLVEVPGPTGDREPVVHAEQAAKVQYYSRQSFVNLSPDETCAFKLKNGTLKRLRLKSVTEFKDSVIGLVRRADVHVEIDDQPLDLVCAPYVMPTEVRGLRLQADTTSAWGNVPQGVQFSLWDATDPVVDTSRFGFPLRNYRLFSHGTQAYDEPVHLGAGDGDPAGQRFYHDYGFDTAGYEGREEVISAVEGKIIKFWPSREDPCSVVVQDHGGLIWDHAHLKALAPELALGAHVGLGQSLGILGKTGPSGNFSHLHLGTYLAPHDLDLDRANRRLNLYPWLVTAYQSRHPKGLLAVARPHQTVLTGEAVVLDGGNSLAWGGRSIREWRWNFPDGQTVKRAKAAKRFHEPGAYVATLRVKDDRGAEDVDFCQIKVFSKAKPEQAMPHIFMTHTPTRDLRPAQPVTFRLWFQGKGDGPLKVDFGDGTQLAQYASYSEFSHRFKAPGIYIVTAQCNAAGRPIMQKQKVVVTATAGTQE